MARAMGAGGRSGGGRDRGPEGKAGQRAGREEMRFQLMGVGWPFASYLVPPGTILDSADWTWNGIPLPGPPGERVPINVLCLDQSAANQWAALYRDQRFRFFGAPGVVLPP